MITKRNAAMLFAGLALLGSCKNNTKTNAAEVATVDTKIVLSVGKVNITGYEYEKNLKAFKANFIHTNRHEPQNTDIQNWTNEFINRSYFLADAYAKGYDKDKHIDSLVEGAAHQMIAQPHGIMDKAIEAAIIQPGSDEIETAIERSKKKIHIEYFKFNDEQTALKIFNNNIPQNADGFHKALNNIDLLYVTYKQETIAWPFTGFAGMEDYVFDLQDNSVSKLLKLNDGYYLLHVMGINEMPVPKFSEKSMSAQLQFVKKQKFIVAYYAKIKQQAYIEVDRNTIYLFAAKLSNSVYGSNHTLIKGSFYELLPKGLLTYISPHGQKVLITVSDFIDYYNTLFLKPAITDANSVFSCLNTIAVGSYFYNDAVNRGITRQPQFALDKNNFKNEMIYNKYQEDELQDKSPVRTGEIMQVYNLMKPGFIQATDAVVSVWYFSNKLDALLSISKLQLKRDDTLQVKGLISVKKHLKVNYKNNVLPDTLKKIIFALKNNTFSRPIYIDNSFVLIKLESATGSRVMQLSEVKGMAIKAIENERLYKNQKSKLQRLKTLYAIENNIKYNNYQNESHMSGQ